MISAERAHIHIAAKSHPGMSGKNNEDRFAVSAFRTSQENPEPVVFAIISDGIGGHRAGEIAAEITVDSISQYIAASDAATPIESLIKAITQANLRIIAESEVDPKRHGMGATCACCWIIDDRLYIANVGDSRIYMLREGLITQLTSDHTWIQEALDIGLLTPEEAAEHPNAHVIRRYLGSPKSTTPDMRLILNKEESESQSEKNQGLKLRPGDQFLLCSDGLTDLVYDDEILHTLETHALDASLDKLINLANQRGGHDNITIIALQVPLSINQAEPTLPGVRQKEARKRYILAGLLALLGILILVGGFLTWNIRFRGPGLTIENTPTEPIVLPDQNSTYFPTATELPLITAAPIMPISEPTLTPWPVTPASP